ncbi:MAG: glycosyltransferase family 4 protein [Spirochaetales bacterium]|nr:glycosyltransferase family 4 protein [Spirochaetales bacterium]
MKILYDHQILIMQKYGGISRYFYELITNLKQMQAADICVSACFSKNYYFESYFGKKSIREKIPFFYFFNKILNENRCLHNLSTEKFDIIHPTYYEPYILKRKNGKLVLTVHDMIHELYSEYFNDNTMQKKKKMINTADAIIAISENTKKDLLTLYPQISEEKIQVIYHGNSFPVQKEVQKKDNYILFTGMRKIYKNFDNFICSVAPLLNKYNLNLICTGPSFDISENNLFKKMNIKDKVFHKSASDAELSNLYSHALLFVFPSMYEGFGIPILEAFASKCPLVCSNTSSLPEVGGDAAIYFDPLDVNDMSEKIESVITSKELQDKLIEKGTEQLKKFSWKQTAVQTFDLYKKL